MLPVRDHLPTRSFPAVNYGLIALNLGVFGGFIGGLVLLPLLRKRGPVDYDAWDRWLGPRRSRLEV